MSVVVQNVSILPLSVICHLFLECTVVGSAAVLLAFAWHDYQQFKALGRGGAPYNVFGWLSVTVLLWPFSLRNEDSFWTGDYNHANKPISEELRDLPARKGPRPRVGGIVPQRQLSQHAPESMREAIHDIFFKAIVEQNPGILDTWISHSENHHPALYVHPKLAQSMENRLPETTRIAQGEIGHIHEDLSYHLYFSESDAREVIQKGWGQRHRLARRLKWYLPGLVDKYPVGLAPTFLLMYGPRDAEELEIMGHFLRASAGFMTGGESIALLK